MQRPSLWAMAAFNWEIARIPTLVKEPMLGAIRRQWWRDAWVEIEAQGPVRQHPVVEALAAARLAHPLPVAAAEGFLDAHDALAAGPPEDMAGMLVVAAGITGNLTRLEAAIVGGDAQQAATIGAAWGLVQLLRRLPQSIPQRQHGLPANRVSQLPAPLEHINPADLPEAMNMLVQDVALLAKANLPSGRPTSPLMRGYCRLSVWYLKRLERAGWDPFADSMQDPKLGRALQVLLVRIGL